MKQHKYIIPNLKLNIDQMKIDIFKVFEEKKGQGSAEMILLIGAIIIIVILVGNYIFEVSKGIDESLKELIEKERDNILYNI